MPITTEDVERIFREESRERYANVDDRMEALLAAVDAKIREDGPVDA